MSTPPTGTETEDVRARWKDSLAHAAESAYRRASADEIPTEARRMRWRVDRRTAVSAAFILGVVGLIGWAMLTGDSEATEEPTTPTPEPSVVAAAPVPVVVHVAGAVAHPGLIELASGQRVGDAITAAGGALEDADLSAVNLARVPQDGEQIRVPVVGEQAVDGGAGLISLSTADSSALEQLPGIGPALAQRIVADREENGPYSTLEDLARVSGIGESLVGGLDGLAVP